MRNKTGGIVLKDYLLDVMQRHEQGLYLCELPTGNGKTYDSAHAMKEYADSIVDDTKIIYLTTLNKNLPEDALRAAYGNDDLYNRNVLRLRSNFDEVVEKILDIQVPEEMQTDVYLKLCKDVSLYRNAIEKKYADKEYIKELTDRITDGDRQLRYEITKRLKKRFSTKARRKNAVRTDAKYKWIGKLYPAVFTDDYRIILMSVSKFMKRNSILIDSSYEFLNSDLIENAIIIIDEFDATKDTIQSELIEKSLAMQEDYIQLFRQIYRTLNPNDFSSDMRLAMERVENSENRNTFTSLMAEAREIAEKYHVRLSIKTREDLVDQRQILLNWEQNEVPLNIGGYKYDKKTKTFPVFINYDKSEDISDTTKYEDHFVPGFRDRLIAISKSGRSLQSEDVQNFLKAKERGIRVELFVRKNKDDKISKEFYYLGHMTASGNTKEFTMPNTQKTAVEIEWILDVPVREDIYEYIVNS